MPLDVEIIDVQVVVGWAYTNSTMELSYNSVFIIRQLAHNYFGCQHSTIVSSLISIILCGRQLLSANYK